MNVYHDEKVKCPGLFDFITSLFVAAGGISAKAPLPSDGNQQKHLDVEIYKNYPPVSMKDETSASFHLQLPKEVASQEQRSLGYKYIGYRKNIQLRRQEGQLDIGMSLRPSIERKLFQVSQERMLSWRAVKSCADIRTTWDWVLF